MSPEIDLDTHIADIKGVFEWEELDDVALIAHSYGGMVASGVADLYWQRIRTLVYVDAAMPEDGQAMLDFVSPERKATVIGLARTEGDGFRVPDSLVLESGLEDAAERAAFAARTSFHPLAALLQPIRLGGNHLKIRNKAYVLASLHPSAQFRTYRDWAAAEPGWTGAELASHHFPMATMPRETAELLMALDAG